MIAPRRFNPKKEAWLPILHIQRGKRRYTAMFSNTAMAHQLKKTRDWLLLYFDDGHGEHYCTIVTGRSAPFAEKRIVRGRERDCAITTKTRSNVYETRDHVFNKEHHPQNILRRHMWASESHQRSQLHRKEPLRPCSGIHRVFFFLPFISTITPMTPMITANKPSPANESIVRLLVRQTNCCFLQSDPGNPPTHVCSQDTQQLHGTHRRLNHFSAPTVR